MSLPTSAVSTTQEEWTRPLEGEVPTDPRCRFPCRAKPSGSLSRKGLGHGPFCIVLRGRRKQRPQPRPQRPKGLMDCLAQAGHTAPGIGLPHPAEIPRRETEPSLPDGRRRTMGVSPEEGTDPRGFRVRVGAGVSPWLIRGCGGSQRATDTRLRLAVDVSSADWRKCAPCRGRADRCAQHCHRALGVRVSRRWHGHSPTCPLFDRRELPWSQDCSDMQAECDGYSDAAGLNSRSPRAWVAGSPRPAGWPRRLRVAG